MADQQSRIRRVAAIGTSFAVHVADEPGEKPVEQMQWDKRFDSLMNALLLACAELTDEDMEYLGETVEEEV